MRARLSYLRWYRASLPDRLARKVAWAIPRRVAYWCALRVGAEATTGPYSDTVVPELTFMDAVKRWDGSAVDNRSA